MGNGVWAICESWLSVALTVGSLACCKSADAGNSSETAIAATIRIDAELAGPQLPHDFAGLSYETEDVLPDAQGRHYFSPQRRELISMFQTLGVRSLRLGGNFADKPNVPIPGESDIDPLFQFAKVAGLKVIYTLRLREVESPEQNARIVAYILSKYPAQAAYFEIGNEPDFYLKTYPAYQEKMLRFAAAIRAAAPGVRFCGPSAGNAAQWARNVAETLGRDKQIALITQHAYFGGDSRAAEKDPAAFRAELLSKEMTAKYQKFYEAFVPTVLANRCQYRIEETNSCYNGGAAGVSDTFAAALWGLDYMHWWALHGAQGLNFHTGDVVAAADDHIVCRYAAFTSTMGGFDAHPLAYAILAFSAGGEGNLVPVKLETSDQTNIPAYVMRSSGGDLFVTIISKGEAGHGENASPDSSVQVAVAVPPSYSRAESMMLLAPRNDLASKTGITFGGASITTDGKWSGRWTPIAVDGAGEAFSVSVQTPSAMVIRFSRGRIQ